MEFIEIDGSYGEGGGQIIRTAVGLSGATGLPIRIHSIRAKRPRPGLSHQHLNAIRAVQILTDAKVEGLEIGSRELSFQPERVNPGRYRIDIGTAGSASLVFQALLIPALCATELVEVDITGGTDVPMSPSTDYIKNVFLKLLSRMGACVDLDVKRRGHYPKGGGLLSARIHPSQLRGLQIERRGMLKGIYGVSHSTSLPAHIAERQRTAAIDALFKDLREKAVIEIETSQAFGEGTGIVLWAEYEYTVLGAASLGKRGKRAELVGEEAAANLLRELKSNATMDVHMADQLIPYIALAKGLSSYTCRPTSHVMTNLYITERVLGTRFSTTQLQGGLVRIECQNP